MTGRVVDVAGTSQVVRFLREHGFPHAERRQFARARELGPIDGTPGLEWAVKPAAGDVGKRQLLMWVAAVDAHRLRLGADLGVLVVARPDVEPGDWQAVLVGGAARARMSLAKATELLVSMGYGDGPPDEDGPCPAA